MTGINDAATLVPAVGHYWYNPTVSAARPTDPSAPGSGWVDLGHTALASPFGIKSTGGAQTVLGTWQNPALRTSNAPRVESIDFELQQWTNTELALYYGSNGDVVGGRYRVPANPVPTTGALFVFVEDGEDQVAFYWPSVSIYRASDIAFDAAKLAGLPVAATILGVSDQTWLYEIDPKGELATLVSIAVTPATPSIPHTGPGTVQLKAVGTYSDGDTHDITTAVAWTSATTADATVGASTGLVTAVIAGSSVITATLSAITGTATVTVT